MDKHEIEAEWQRIAQVWSDGGDPGTLDPADFDGVRRMFVRAWQRDGWESATELYGEAAVAIARSDPFADPSAALQDALAQRWTLLGATDLLRPPEPPDYLVHEMLRCPSLNVVYGAPGDLKTMLCLDLAVCVASGLPWAEPLPDVGTGGAYQVKQGPVLILDQDNGEARLRERFGALLRGRGLTDAPVHAISLPRPAFDASDPDEADLLASQLDALGAVLCVIDNLGTVSGGRDENSSQMVDVMGNLRWVAETTKCAVIVVHHARKGNGGGGREGDRLRGHSSIEASLDLALIVERSDDDLTIRSTKTRDNPVKPFTLRWTYDQTDFGALDKARLWHVSTTAPKLARHKAIGAELGDLLADLDSPPNQGELRAHICARYEVGDRIARQAIAYAESTRVVGYRQKGGHANSPKEYYARDGAGVASQDDLPW
jgi:hypothetical protein